MNTAWPAEGELQNNQAEGNQQDYAKCCSHSLRLVSQTRLNHTCRPSGGAQSQTHAPHRRKHSLQA